jgi:general secretion pathway protein E
MNAVFDPHALLTMPKVVEARTLSRQTARPFIEVLEERSGLPPEQFVLALGTQWQYQVLEMAQLQIMQADFSVLSFNEASRRECLALRDQDQVLWLVLANPYDADLTEWAEAGIGEAYQWGVAHRTDIAAFLSRHEDSMRAMDNMLPEHEVEDSLSSSLADLSLRSISEDTSQVVKLVHSTLYDALKSGVSDIHLESDATRLLIKYRIDGVLVTVGSVPGTALADQVISRIKVMSELDIAERRVPQDGRFKVSVRGREVDFRVSIMPNIYGEDAVLRILDRSTITNKVEGLRLESLGFDSGTLLHFRKMTLEPYGMVLVTGPTGSGKTTTLYAAITEINHGDDKIITIEDPVEYQLPGVLQIPVNEKKGLTFARGLRSILRHDPDKIMVGEIRDPETAQIAVQSALTGHLVFTTVHANSVFDVIGRFMHMGVDPYSFVSAMNGIMSQRLVRLVCPHCMTEQTPTEEMIALSGLAETDTSDYRFVYGTGCGQCRGTGYKGRKAIAEILDLNDEIREMIVAREPIRQLKEAARRSGTRYLREVALDMVKAGETTLQEINRVTFVD